MEKKVIKTADGSETLFNDEYGEAYHSTKAGAYTESLHKFVYPCRIPQLAKEKGYIRVLDVGFGLGYNVAVAIKEAVKSNPKVKLDIISIEKDKQILEKINLLNIHTELIDIYKQIFKGNFSSLLLVNEKIEVYKSEDENFSLKILFGEGRKLIKLLAEENYKFDAVFFDPFSPKVNTEMWTLELFRYIRKLIDKYGIFATYSASLAVRKGLIEAGFKIGLVEPVGRKSYSTVATINGDIPPLTEKEEKRIKNSPYALPYRDNQELTLSKEEIKRNWEEKVKERIS